MRVLVVATPAFPIPPDMLPEIAQGALEWSEQHRDELEVFGTFPGGGGFGVVDVADEGALQQLLLDMPFAPFNHHEIRPFVPGPEGLRRLQETLAARAATAQAQ